MRYRYSTFRVKNRIAKAVGRELAVSPKYCSEIAREIRGMLLTDARKYLMEVIEKKRSVPIKKHCSKVRHRSDLVGWHSGRYPQKAAKLILKVLDNAEANAEYKGLDIERLRIAHICAKKGRVIKGYIPRAYGRATPFNKPLTNVEVVLEEV